MKATDIDSSVLPMDALQLLRGISSQRSLGQDFYLAGGTGLALLLGHRISRDLDFFTATATDRIPPAAQRAISALPGQVSLRERGQVDLDVRGTRVSFIAYPFPLVHELYENGPIRLAAPEEIALMKAYSLGRRITARDYVDLYYLLSGGHTSLERIRREADAKFRLDNDRVFSYMGFLRLLVDSSDVEDWEETLSMVRDRSITREAIDDYFVGLVQEVDGIE